MRIPMTGRGLLLMVVGSLLVAVGASSALGAIPNSGTYSACLAKSTGAVEIINSPKVKCAKGERLIKWGQQGPPGTPGAQGPQGPQGPAGAQGAAGTAGITKITLTTYVNGTAVSSVAGTTGAQTATCPAGAKVVGGGFDNSANLRVTSSFAATPTTWKVIWKNIDGGAGYVNPYATCLTTDPSTVIAKASHGRVARKSGK